MYSSYNESFERLFTLESKYKGIMNIPDNDETFKKVQKTFLTEREDLSVAEKINFGKLPKKRQSEIKSKIVDLLCAGYGPKYITNLLGVTKGITVGVRNSNRIIYPKIRVIDTLKNEQKYYHQLKTFSNEIGIEYTLSNHKMMSGSLINNRYLIEPVDIKFTLDELHKLTIY